MIVRTSPKPWPAEVDARFQTAFQTLERAQAQNLLSAWSAATAAGALSVFFADEFSPSEKSAHHDVHPHFDLASLTKPLFLNTLVRQRWPAHSLAQVSLQDLLESAPPFAQPFQHVGEILRSTGSLVTLLDFLNHATGVFPWVYFGRQQHFQTAQWMAALTQHMCSQLSARSTAQNYSDVGYFLLARILEGLGGPYFSWETTLQQLNQHLGTHYSHASLRAQSSHASLLPASGARAVPYFPYRMQEANDCTSAVSDVTFGPVHDTNANILAHASQVCLAAGAGPLVSGHAGLFGSVLDVSASVRWLQESQCNLAALWETQSSNRFQLGLDTPTSVNSLAGISRWPLPAEQKIFGHLGYTGGSFWFSIKNQRPANWQVLLTNRTAHRVDLGFSRAPRLAVFTPRHNLSTSQYFLVSGARLVPVSQDDFMSLSKEWCGIKNLSWDASYVEAVADIGAVRRQVGSTLWSL